MNQNLINRDYKTVEIFYLKNIKIVTEDQFDKINLRKFSEQFEQKNFYELIMKPLDKIPENENDRHHT